MLGLHRHLSRSILVMIYCGIDFFPFTVDSFSFYPVMIAITQFWLIFIKLSESETLPGCVYLHNETATCQKLLQVASGRFSVVVVRSL